MNAECERLYQQMEGDPVDEPGASYPFAARLASKNHWQPDYAKRVVAEYKRFIFLAESAGHPVAPSEAVDEAWRLHLTDRPASPERLRGETLRWTPRRDPTAFRPSERERIAREYAQTLDSYRRLLGCDPPPDIWPAAKGIHAAEPPRGCVPRWAWVRQPIDKSTLILIRLVAPLIVPVIVLACRAAYSFATAGQFKLPEPDTASGARVASPEERQLLGLVGAALVAATAVAVFLRWYFRGPGGPAVGVSDLDTYEAAYLAGGRKAVVAAALTSLAGDQLLHVRGADGLARGPAAEGVGGRHPVEQAVWRVVDPDSGAKVAEVLAGAEMPPNLPNRLEAHGLILSRTGAILGRFLPTAVAILVPLAGIAWALMSWQQGSAGHHAFLAAFVVLWGLLVFAPSLGRSRRGDLALGQLRGEVARRAAEADGGRPPLSGAELARAVGLFGIAPLENGTLAPLHAALLAAYAAPSRDAGRDIDHDGSWDDGGDVGGEADGDVDAD